MDPRGSHEVRLLDRDMRRRGFLGRALPLLLARGAVVLTICSTGKPAAGGTTAHGPLAFEMVEKPVVVRNPPGFPPGRDVLNRLLTEALPLRVRSAR